MSVIIIHSLNISIIFSLHPSSQYLCRFCRAFQSSYNLYLYRTGISMEVLLPCKSSFRYRRCMSCPLLLRYRHNIHTVVQHKSYQPYLSSQQVLIILDIFFMFYYYLYICCLICAINAFFQRIGRNILSCRIRKYERRRAFS